MLPPEGERLWTLNAVRVPDGVDEAAVRKQLLEEYSIEIGAGLGPLAGKIWRVGLMGASSTPRLVILLLGALQTALAKRGVHAQSGPRAARPKRPSLAKIAGRGPRGRGRRRVSAVAPTPT